MQPRPITVVGITTTTAASGTISPVVKNSCVVLSASVKGRRAPFQKMTLLYSTLLQIHEVGRLGDLSKLGLDAYPQTNLSPLAFATPGTLQLSRPRDTAMISLHLTLDWTVVHPARVEPRQGRD